MTPIPTHVPRGFMCMCCKHVHRKCNHLDFTKMQVIGIFKDDGVKEVKCVDHVRRRSKMIEVVVKSEWGQYTQKLNHGYPVHTDYFCIDA